jgi:hypothetical protein
MLLSLYQPPLRLHTLHTAAPQLATSVLSPWYYTLVQCLF